MPQHPSLGSGDACCLEQVDPGTSPSRIDPCSQNPANSRNLSSQNPAIIVTALFAVSC